MDTLGKKLYTTRKKNSMTINELAEKVNIDPEILKSYEKNDIGDLDINILMQLTDILDIDFVSLAEFEEIPLSKKIRYYRKKLNLTQQDLADYIDVSHSAVSRWESGEIKHISQDKIIRLAEVLELPPLALISPSYSKLNDSVNPKYLEVARKLQELHVPIEICQQMIDIFSNLKEN